MFIHVTAVEYLDEYKLHLRFNTGAEGVVDYYMAQSSNRCEIQRSSGRYD